MHFDARAEVYERFRLPYPDALWTRLQALGILRDGLRAVELGAGPGEATARLVERGVAVTAVEPGSALADRLRRRVPAAEVVVSTAEDVALPAAAFDVAFVATAIHWFDLEVVVPMLHRALRRGGQLAVWRTIFHDPEAPTPFRDRISEIAARGMRPERPSGLDTVYWTRALTASGHFVERHSEMFRWSVDLGTDQVRGLFSTFSDWNAGEVEGAARVVDDLGGRVTEHYVTTLIVLDRVDGAT
jgi:SAM-dependent methyltransferase